MDTPGTHTGPLPLLLLCLQAWNAGLAAGGAGDLQEAAVLLAVCGELLAVLPTPTPAALHKQKVRRIWLCELMQGLTVLLLPSPDPAPPSPVSTAPPCLGTLIFSPPLPFHLFTYIPASPFPQMAFLMGAAMAADVYEQQAAEQAGDAAGAADPSAAPSIALARAYLADARRAAAALSDARAAADGERGGGGQGGADAKSDVYLLLLVSAGETSGLGCLREGLP